MHWVVACKSGFPPPCCTETRTWVSLLPGTESGTQEMLGNQMLDLSANNTGPWEAGELGAP